MIGGVTNDKSYDKKIVTGGKIKVSVHSNARKNNTVPKYKSI